MNDLYSKVYIYLQLGFRGALLYKRDKRQCVFYSPELWGINAMVFIRMLCFMTKNENDSKKRNKAKRTSKECYAHIAFLPTPT